MVNTKFVELSLSFFEHRQSTVWNVLYMIFTWVICVDGLVERILTEHSGYAT